MQVLRYASIQNSDACELCNESLACTCYTSFRAFCSLEVVDVASAYAEDVDSEHEVQIPLVF
jgi:hypothetical protein